MIDRNEGHQRAIDLLRECSTPEGFLASPTDRDNYRRVWARDGVIAGLAGLASGDAALIRTLRATLQTLARHRGPHGEIPSNVDVSRNSVSFGMTAGRVDASLWFVIGCAAYWRRTREAAFVKRMLPALRDVRRLLGAWEFNTRGLLYVPQTGDWSDEYVQEGYVLYDQLLYWRALRDMADMESGLQPETETAKVLKNDAKRLRALIVDNYWFGSDAAIKNVYHPTLHAQGRKASGRGSKHWIPSFSPTGYRTHFDALANTLASLFGIADDIRSMSVDRFVEDSVADRDMALLPAFSPVIHPGDARWDAMRSAYSFSFKNEPYAFHNGGLWPFITAFYATDLARRGKKAVAERYLVGVDAANKLGADAAGEWGFHEFIHGKTHLPGGTRRQCWNAAAVVIARAELRGVSVL